LANLQLKKSDDLEQLPQHVLNFLASSLKPKFATKFRLALQGEEVEEEDLSSTHQKARKKNNVIDDLPFDLLQQQQPQITVYNINIRTVNIFDRRPRNNCRPRTNKMKSKKSFPMKSTATTHPSSVSKTENLFGSRGNISEEQDESDFSEDY
jgi:hypothetical protein